MNQISVHVPSKKKVDKVYEGDILRSPGDGPRVTAIIVAATPTSDNEPKSAYTFGVEPGSCIVTSQYDEYRRSSARGALANVTGFSTDALMLQKAAEKRREHRWSE